MLPCVACWEWIWNCAITQYSFRPRDTSLSYYEVLGRDRNSLQNEVWRAPTRGIHTSTSLCIFKYQSCFYLFNRPVSLRFMPSCHAVQNLVFLYSTLIFSFIRLFLSRGACNWFSLKKLLYMRMFFWHSGAHFLPNLCNIQQNFQTSIQLILGGLVVPSL